MGVRCVCGRPLITVFTNARNKPDCIDVCLIAALYNESFPLAFKTDLRWCPFWSRANCYRKRFVSLLVHLRFFFPYSLLFFKYTTNRWFDILHVIKKKKKNREKKGKNKFFFKKKWQQHKLDLRSTRLVKRQR